MSLLTFPPSAMQQTIYEWIHDGEGSASVIAVAGSGKTTTLVTGLRHRPNLQDRTKLFAFNTKIADELKERTKGMPGVSATTFHGQGYGALCRKLNMQKLPVAKGNSKLRGIIWDWLTRHEALRYADWLVELVGLARGAGIGIEGLCADTPHAWKQLVDHHELEIEGVKSYERDDAEAYGIELASALLSKSIDAATDDFLIDFDDMLYLPLYWGLDLNPVPWVLLDEAQDTNAVRREFVARSLAPGGRLIAVGDPNQAIYGFTGASIDAMELIKDQFHTIDLPLSVCYRCARKIVEAAQELVPQILPADDAPEGAIDWLDVRDGLKTLPPTAAVLCRNSAPLMRAAYWLIGQKIGCRVLGADIGVGLIKLIERMRATTIDDLESELIDYAAKQGQKLREKGEDAQAAAIDDRVASLRIVIQHLPHHATIETLKAELIRLFEDRDTGVLTLSTIHKAKGLEWPTVAILHPDLIPSFWATTDWQRQQEYNLKYVAITRARERLVWLNGSLTQPEED